MSLDQHDRTGGGHAAGAAGVPVAEAVAEGLASVRREGLEPDAAGLHVLDEVAAGRLSIADALELVLSASRTV